MSNTENVLILQGGGSLGAFGCGVFKALANSNIKIDIIAGTSISGLNAAIMASSKEDHPEKTLEHISQVKSLISFYNCRIDIWASILCGFKPGASK